MDAEAAAKMEKRKEKEFRHWPGYYSPVDPATKPPMELWFVDIDNNPFWVTRDQTEAAHGEAGRVVEFALLVLEPHANTSTAFTSGPGYSYVADMAGESWKALCHVGSLPSDTEHATLFAKGADHGPVRSPYRARAKGAARRVGSIHVTRPGCQPISFVRGGFMTCCRRHEIRNFCVRSDGVVIRGRECRHPQWWEYHDHRSGKSFSAVNFEELNTKLQTCMGFGAKKIGRYGWSKLPDDVGSILHG